MLGNTYIHDAIIQARAQLKNVLKQTQHSLGNNKEDTKYFELLVSEMCRLKYAPGSFLIVFFHDFFHSEVGRCNIS